MSRPQKVIRTKRIYRKRRSNKRALGQIAFVLGVLLVIGLGYIVMKEWSARFGKNADKNPSSSQVTSDSQCKNDTSDNTSSQTDDSKEASFTKAKNILYTDVCNKSKEQLVAMFNSIKDEGYDAFYVNLKTEDGVVHFISNTQYVKQYNLVAPDAVDLNALVSAANEAKITPIAAITTLKDSTAHVERDNSYSYSNTQYNWLDAAYESGGKPWLNPYKQNTKDYIASLAGELYESGIKVISLEDVNFPLKNTEQMNPGDVTISRNAALAELIAAVKAKTGDALLINTVDIVTQTAVSQNAFLADLKEIAYKNTALKIDVSLIEQNRAVLANKVFAGNNAGASALDIAKQMIKSVAEDQNIGNDTFIVLSTADYQNLKSTLEENNIKSYVLK